jgi:hypothetical protein
MSRCLQAAKSSLRCGPELPLVLCRLGQIRLAGLDSVRPSESRAVAYDERVSSAAMRANDLHRCARVAPPAAPTRRKNDPPTSKRFNKRVLHSCSLVTSNSLRYS